MSYYAAKIYVNEIGFHASAPTPLELMSGQSNRRSWYHAHARNESLIRCLEAAVGYLECFLSLPPEEVLNFTLTDFIRLIYTILILGRYTTGIDAPTLDAASARKTANLGYYLTALSNKTRNLSEVAYDSECNNYIWHLNKLFEQSKLWHNQVTTDPSTADSYFLFAPELTFMQILPAIIDCHVDLSGADETCQNWTQGFYEWNPSLDPSNISLDSGLQ